jgi:NodT family efflux transporter outer membrane factor (OMF) lipoprotein
MKWVGGLLVLLLAGCTVGPNYHRPSAPAAPAFKESAVVPPPDLPGGGWKQVTPNDSAMRPNWWEIYQDPELDKLEQQVAVSNQTLKASYEQYMQARAAIQFYRAQYYPTVSVGPSATRERQSANRPLYVPGSKTNYNDLFLQGQVAWEPDLWGNIRRAVESQRAVAQATAADLANVDLSLRSELATDYFELRGLDTQQRLLDNTVKQYEDYLSLTQARFKGGVATDSDVALAQTQLDQTRAQAIDVGVARAQYEHAIATLTGTPASSFGLPPAPLDLQLPQVPVGVPSQLLERRPDVAASERRTNAANAQIGIAIAAYYPTINITGTGGFSPGAELPLVSWWLRSGVVVRCRPSSCPDRRGQGHVRAERGQLPADRAAGFPGGRRQSLWSAHPQRRIGGARKGSRVCPPFAADFDQPLQGRGHHLP